MNLAALERPLKCHSETLQWDTGVAPQFIDITDEVDRVVRHAQVRDGMVSVYSQHTTSAIKIIEHEPLLLHDLESMLRRVAPPDAAYYHNDFNIRTVNMCPDERTNAHAHCQHLFLGTSETIPLQDGVMRFGPWQRIFLVELDGLRCRNVIVQVLGM